MKCASKELEFLGRAFFQYLSRERPVVFAVVDDQPSVDEEILHSSAITGRISDGRPDPQVLQINDVDVRFIAFLDPAPVLKPHDLRGQRGLRTDDMFDAYGLPVQGIFFDLVEECRVGAEMDRAKRPIISVKGSVPASPRKKSSRVRFTLAIAPPFFSSC